MNPNIIKKYWTNLREFFFFFSLLLLLFYYMDWKIFAGYLDYNGITWVLRQTGY